MEMKPATKLMKTQYARSGTQQTLLTELKVRCERGADIVLK